MALKLYNTLNRKKKKFYAYKRQSNQAKEIFFKSIFVFFFHKSLLIAIAVFVKLFSVGFFKKNLEWPPLRAKAAQYTFKLNHDA